MDADAKRLRLGAANSDDSATGISYLISTSDLDFASPNSGFTAVVPLHGHLVEPYHGWQKGP